MNPSPEAPLWRFGDFSCFGFYTGKFSHFYHMELTIMHRKRYNKKDYTELILIFNRKLSFGRNGSFLYEDYNETGFHGFYFQKSWKRQRCQAVSS